jgi:hypothetical protein
MGVLRNLFGPSREEIWGQFAAAVGGSLEDGGWTGNCRVEAAHGEWVVTLDTFTVSTGKSAVTYTRMRAPFVNPDRFSFSLSRRGIFTGVAELLGLKDLEVGFPEFDQAFVIKGNDVARLRQLFADARLRELIAAQPAISFCVRDDDGWWTRRNFPADVDELYFQVGGVIKDVNRLQQLYALFAETLDQLCRMGSAYEKAPGVKL